MSCNTAPRPATTGTALRRAWPWVYETHADLRLDGWTHIKIEVAGRAARLYLNRNPDTALVVDGLEGAGPARQRGTLFTFVNKEGYFSNVRITARRATADHRTDPTPPAAGDVKLVDRRRHLRRDAAAAA